MTAQERYSQQKGYNNKYKNQLQHTSSEEVLTEQHKKMLEQFQQTKEFQAVIDSAAKIAAEKEIIKLLCEIKL